MKKKMVIALCVGALAATAMMTGCTKEEKATTEAVTETPTAVPTETATPTPTEVVLKTIGAEDETAYKVQLKNNTGLDIAGVAIKLTDEAEFPVSMLADNDPFTAGTADVEEKVLEQGYDIQITLSDGTAYVLHSFPFDDIEKGDICLADGLAYLQYESLSTKEKVETKEAEQAVLDQAAAEAAAEEAARLQAEAQAQAEAEEAARAEAEAQAAAEAKAQAQAAAEAEAQAAAEAQADSSSDDSSSEDGCLDDGLFY